MIGAKSNLAQHVNTMISPLPPAARDRSPLWRDFTKGGFERPFMVKYLQNIILKYNSYIK
jgi:hypothetical protein